MPQPQQSTNIPARIAFNNPMSLLCFFILTGSCVLVNYICIDNTQTGCYHNEHSGRSDSTVKIELRVKELALRRGVQSISELKERVGVAYDTAADLWHGRTKRIDRDTLAKVCSALECDPGDILIYHDDDGDVSDDSNSVLSLERLITQGVAA
jgi:putative transcriptional regulator